MCRNPVLLFVLTIAVLALFLPSYTQLQDIKLKNQEYEQQIRDLKAQNIDLREEKRRLVEDPLYLEKVAREKMGLIKEGEVVYQILPANQIAE